jgi:hypothetical protein
LEDTSRKVATPWFVLIWRQLLGANFFGRHQLGEVLLAALS